VTLSFQKLSNAIEMIIQDTGCGIDSQNLPVVFERAYQVSHRASGNELVLKLTRQIIEAHHGKITVSSPLGKNSTFTVWLPLTSADRMISQDG
jgi:signal transduction histidine kinase